MTVADDTSKSGPGGYCYASELATRTAAAARVSVHAMLRSEDSAVARSARRNLVEALVQRAWTLDAIERWYGMRQGAAAAALHLPAARVAKPVASVPPRRSADPSPRMGRPKTREAPVCPCGVVGPIDGNDRNFVERRVAKWGDPTYVCRTCAGSRIRARTDAKRDASTRRQAVRAAARAVLDRGKAAATIRTRPPATCACGFPLVEGRCFGCETARATLEKTG